MISPDRIDAVVFDMGGVFVVPSPVVMASIAAEAGIELRLDGDAAHRAHHDGVAAITATLGDGCVDETDPAVWDAYDHAWFASVGVAAGDRASAVACRRRAREQGRTAELWSWVLEDNRAAFAAIARHRPTAIVSNNNGTAVRQCLDMGICQVGPGPLTEVAAIVDSAVVGVAKPDPAIFTPALEALGTAPARTLYVGDTVHADVRGATAAGMPVVQLDPFDHHADHGHWRLPDVTALADLLA